MLLPKVPSHFRKRLREFDPSLSVRFTPGAGGWTIFQSVPRAFYCGMWNGRAVYNFKRQPEKVMTVPGLGSRIFEVLRRSRVRRYRNFDAYCKEMGLPVG